MSDCKACGFPGDGNRLAERTCERDAAFREIDALRIRQQELLVTIRNLSLLAPYPEEASDAATLIAEVGTLKARIAEVERERDEALAAQQRLMIKAINASEQLSDAHQQVADLSNQAQRMVERIARYVERCNISVPYPQLCRKIADSIRSGVWKQGEGE